MAGNAGKGRPAGSRNKATLAMMELLEAGETPCGFALRLMRDEQQKLDVRLNAAKIAATYLHPKPPPEARVAAFDLPDRLDTLAAVKEAHAGVLRAVADGDLSPADAGAVSALIDTQRRAIEAADLEARVARLEGERGAGPVPAEDGAEEADAAA